MKHHGLEGGVLAMEKVREVLRLAAQGFSQREIHRATRVARSCVQEYLRRAKTAGVTPLEAAALSDTELRARLLKKSPGRQEKAAALPDWGTVHKELSRRKGTTLELLWLEWQEQGGGGISYSTFCRRYHAWAKTMKVEYRTEYRPGEKFLSDFAGEKLSYRDESNERRSAEIFVGVLGFSGYLYAEAVPSQKLPHWVGAHTRACASFGGVAACTIIDNLKSGVTKPDRYEPELNKTFAEWAEHFSTTVLPTRAGKPQDKGKVEQAVQNVERWVLAPLRHETFESMGALNRAIKERVEWLNHRVMERYDVSRHELFTTGEKMHLKPLPALPFPAAEWKRATVHMDYHIQYEKHCYSAPFYLARQVVWVRATEKLIEIFHDNKRVAAHKRAVTGHFTTEAMHLPPEHLAMKSQTAPGFLAWAETVGAEMSALVDAILTKPQYQEQSFRSVLGLQRLEKKYGKAALEDAARTANVIGHQSQRSVRLLLEKRAQEKQEPLTHKNVRGSSYYH